MVSNTGYSPLSILMHTAGCTRSPCLSNQAPLGGKPRAPRGLRFTPSGQDNDCGPRRRKERYKAHLVDTAQTWPAQVSANAQPTRTAKQSAHRSSVTRRDFVYEVRQVGFVPLFSPSRAAVVLLTARFESEAARRAGLSTQGGLI